MVVELQLLRAEWGCLGVERRPGPGTWDWIRELGIISLRWWVMSKGKYFLISIQNHQRSTLNHPHHPPHLVHSLNIFNSSHCFQLFLDKASSHFICQVLEYHPEPQNKWVSVINHNIGRRTTAVISIGPTQLPCLPGKTYDLIYPYPDLHPPTHPTSSNWYDMWKACTVDSIRNSCDVFRSSVSKFLQPIQSQQSLQSHKSLQPHKSLQSIQFQMSLQS